MFDSAALWGKTLSHAYILTGGTPQARLDAARALSAALVCTGPADHRPCGTCHHCKKVAGGIHPDVTVIQGDGGKPINVSQVRALRADAYVRPNEAERKVYLLQDADEMNDSAQNAMLKLLEEGPAYAAFLLLAEHGHRLLATVRSRCELLRLEETAQLPAEPEVEEAAAVLASAYLDGREAEFLFQLIPCEKWERERIASLLSCLTARFRDRIVAGAGREETLRLLHGIQTAETLRQACDYNAAPGHLCGWLAGALFQAR